MSTGIEWTDETWNPVTGCTKVSQGCKNCYAERLAPKVFAGQTTITKDFESRKRLFTDVVMHPERLDAPLHWRKPRRIFVNSMSDLFHEDVPVVFIASVLGIAAAADWHTFQVLTKRPQRMLDVLSSSKFDVAFEDSNDMHTHTEHTWPPANIWLGVSVEDQETADERIPLLRQTPASVRFLSCEPLLGPIDLAPWFLERLGPTRTSPLHWVIAGGESGPKARPSHPDWFRSLRDQCAAAAVPFFFKQWGEWGPCETEVNADEFGAVVYPLEQPVLESLYALDRPRRIRTVAERGIEFGRFGKKLNGRTLDGREHMEWPA